MVQPARDWQARRIGQIAFGATVLFLAQLYLAPTQWFPVTEPLRLALVLSGVSLAALAVHRLVTNKPLWLGWRGALLVAAAGVLLFAPSTFWLRNETISTYAEDVSVQGRMQAWQVAARIVRERPLLERGLSWFLYALCAFASCIDRYGGRKAVEVEPTGSYGSPLRAA